jgi:hypothetical protein
MTLGSGARIAETEGRTLRLPERTIADEHPLLRFARKHVMH